MNAPSLIPMICSKCQNPLAANPNEVAWACGQCGQGMLLTKDGLAPIEIHYAAGVAPNAKGRPFWVAEGQVALGRDTYRGDQSGEASRFWQTPRLFFVPAYSLPLDQLIGIGSQWAQQPPQFQAGTAVPFAPVILLPEDVRPLAEMIVVGIEAARKDSLRELRIQMTMKPPALWVLP